MTQTPSEQKSESLIARLARLSRTDAAPDEFLKAYFLHVRAAMSAEAGGIWIHSSETRQLVPKVTLAPEDGPLRGVPDDVLAKIVYRTIEQRMPLLYIGGAALPGDVDPSQRLLGAREQFSGEIVADASAADQAQQQKDSQVPGLREASLICLPVEVDEKTTVAVLLARRVRDGAAFTSENVHVLQSLGAYLVLYFSHMSFKLALAASARLGKLADIESDLAATSDKARMAFVIANRIREAVPFDRVFTAYPRRGSFRIEAISGVDEAEPKSAVVRTLSDLVREIARIGGDWHFTPGYLEKVEDLALKEKLTVYFETSQFKSILFTRMEDDKGLLAVVCFERRDQNPYGSAELQFLQAFAKSAARALRRAEEFNNLPAIGAVLRLQSLKDRALGPQRRRFYLKIAAGAVAAAVLLLARMELTVKGDCRISPYMTTFAAARASGTVRQILKNEGDTVTKGETVALLDDREVANSIMELERQIEQKQAAIDYYHRTNDITRWSTERKSLEILQLQLEGANLQKELTSITSPQDGVIITPKDRINVSLDAAVARGQAICEVADLSTLYVEVFVGERDVALVATGQPIEFVLSGAPGRLYRSRVESVSPVTRQYYGKNVFVAQGILDNSDGAFHIGVTGSAGVPVGRRPLLYVIFRSTIDRLRGKFL